MGNIKVDSDRCIRCGACIAIAPDTFDYGEDGESVVKNTEVTDEAIQASEMCPVSAIEVTEDKKEDEQ